MTSDNGSRPPSGYQAPIFTAMTKDKLVAYVPRSLLLALVTFCVGAGFYWRSVGVIVVYVLLHGLMALATWNDRQWPHVWKEALQYRWKVWRMSRGR